jgi:hypothetical protein
MEKERRWVASRPKVRLPIQGLREFLGDAQRKGCGAIMTIAALLLRHSEIGRKKGAS